MNIAESLELRQNLEQLVRSGNLSAVIDLIRSGANPNDRNIEGLTLLMIAAGLGQSRMVEVLLTAGADALVIEPRMGLTALHKASQSGNPDVINLLLDFGAFIDQQAPIFGNTPLMDAAWHKHKAAVKLLLERGARITPKNHYQENASDIARASGIVEIIELFKKQEITNNEIIEKQTLLAAVKAGNVIEVKKNIESKADLNERAPLVGNYDDDYTPLGIAARDGHAEIVTILLKAGADVRRTNGLMKSTPAHEAAYEGRGDILKLLLQTSRPEGAPSLELDAQGLYNGLSALHDAIWHGHLEAARVLIEAEAPLYLTTHTGLTPRGLAASYGYTELAKLIYEAENKLI